MWRGGGYAWVRTRVCDVTCAKGERLAVLVGGFGNRQS